MKNYKVVNKVIFVLMITIVSLLIIQNVSLAADSPYLNPPVAEESSLSEAATTVGGIILAIAQAIGVSVAVIMLIYLGIKYISSAPNDRAEIKKHAVVYIVGATLLFAASGILGIIRGFAQSSFGKNNNYSVKHENGKTYYYDLEEDPKQQNPLFYIDDETGQKYVRQKGGGTYVLNSQSGSMS